MDTAIEFYTKTLELEVNKRYENHYAEIGAPGLTIGLHPTEKAIAPGNNISIGFGPTDFDGWVKKLKAAGVAVTVRPDGWSRIAGFSDPDGNALYLIEGKN